MIIIADSGGSKTDWRILKETGSIDQFRSGGYNAYTQSIDDLKSDIGDHLLPKLKGEKVEKVFFYGAGVSSTKSQDKIKNSFHSFFPEASVEIGWDLLAAARALCGAEPGIACILGTGSNSCFYDGHSIVENIASLGWMLADEGSGATLGKQLITDYLRHRVPEEIEKHLRARYPFSREDFLEKIYQDERPAMFLSSFSKFIFQHLKNSYCYELVYKGFSQFYENNVMRYKNYEDQRVHFTGSVAFYFSNVLRQVANDKGISVRNILESPIAGLTLYHQTKLKES